MAERKEYLDETGLARYHSHVNDMTTGINLVRGTRDFRLGVDPIAHVYKDGFSAAISQYISIIKGDDGFSIGHLEQHGTSTNVYRNFVSSAITNFKKGDVFTLSFEFMVDDASTYIDQKFPFALVIRDITTSQNLASTTYSLLNLGIPQVVESKVWYTAKVSYEVVNDITENHVLYCAFQLIRDGSINFRKLMVQNGKISHPVWSPAPADLALEPINDMTTGINLLRGTRDFSYGSNHWNGSLNWTTDGFSPTDTEKFFTKSIDENGFTVLHTESPNGSTTVKSAYASVLTGFNSGDVVTYSFDFMIDDIDEYFSAATSHSIARYDVFDQNANVSSSGANFTLYDGVSENVQSGKWYRWSKAITLSGINSSRDGVMFSSRITRSGGISFRKFKLERGTIINPIYSVSPADVLLKTDPVSGGSALDLPLSIANGGTGASTPAKAKENLEIDDVTIGVNLIRGTRDFTQGTIDASYQDPSLSPHIYTNGFYIYAFEKQIDEDGFTVLHIDRSGLASNNVALCVSNLVSINNNETITVSFEAKTDNINDITDRAIAMGRFHDDSNVIFDQGAMILEPDTVNGEWVTLTRTYTPSRDAKSFVMWIRMPRNGSLYVRKLRVYKGKINNTAWSPAPADLVLGPVNDYTTGINLLKGTRDFRLGIQNRLINNNECSLDGFIIRANSQYISFYKDEQDITVAKLHYETQTAEKNFDLNSSIFLVEHFGIYTVSFEVMIDNVEDWNVPKSEIAVARTVNDNYLSINRVAAGLSNPQSGEWYPIKLEVNVTSGSKWFELVFRAQGNVSINYRKAMVQYGKINNPIWSPAPSDLAMDPINDVTTGINLLRGTRDFDLGKTIIPGTTNNRYIDGFNNSGGYTFSKDSEGFTIAERTLSSSDTLTPRVLDAYLAQPEFDVDYTVSCEMFLSEDFMPTSVPFAYFLNNKSGSVLYSNFIPTNKLNLTPGKWNKLVCSFRLNDATELPENCYLGIRISIDKPSTVRVRKLNLQKGRIENPEWSASPFDVVMEPVNDFTTETNLLRGTRDLKKGTKQWVGANYFDGFYQSGTLFDLSQKDSDGFAIAHAERHGLSENAGYALASSVVTEVKVGEYYTFSFDFMTDDLSEFSATQAIARIQPMDSTSAVIESLDATYSSLGISKPESGKWYRVSYTVKISNAKTVALKALVRLERNGSLYFKKLCLNRGTIANPLYSVSPFDVAQQSDMEVIQKGAPLFLGEIPSSNLISSSVINPDLDDYIVAGVYGCISNALAKNIKNIPQESAFKLYVEYTHGNDYYRRQKFVSYDGDANTYIRFIENPTAGGKWTPWRKTYANTTVRPIEGGGTGTNRSDYAVAKLLYPGSQYAWLKTQEALDAFRPEIPTNITDGNYNATVQVGIVRAISGVTFNVPFYGMVFTISGSGQTKQILFSDNQDRMAYRAYVAGSSSWTDWRIVYTSKETIPIANGGTGRTDGFSQGSVSKLIENNTDLNTIKTAGIYICPLTTGVETITNRPNNEFTSSKYAFALEVIPFSGGNGSVTAPGVFQLYYEFTTNNVYMRHSNGSGTFTKWEQFYTSKSTIPASQIEGLNSIYKYEFDISSDDILFGTSRFPEATIYLAGDSPLSLDDINDISESIIDIALVNKQASGDIYIHVPIVSGSTYDNCIRCKGEYIGSAFYVIERVVIRSDKELSIDHVTATKYFDL